jgi:hypothetical protein
MAGLPEGGLIHDWDLEEGAPEPARPRVEL